MIAALTSLPMNLQLIKAIELFEQYPSNTFLHHSVVDVLTSLFKHSGITNTMKTPTTTTTSTSGGNGNANDTFNPNFSTSKKTNQIDDNQSPSSTTPDLSSSSSSVDSGVTITAADSSTDTAKVTAATVVMNTTHFDEFNSILINLIKDHHLIDWCLRLSPLPGKNDR
ncbi:unnamed protein product [Trichobilharzia regenti]|nr:unnamed protein product [Trichobilharzia regenti]